MAKQITIGELSVELLKAGYSPKDAVAAVLKVFPDAKTTVKCMYWYASHNNIPLLAKKKVNLDELAKLRTSIKG